MTNFERIKEMSFFYKMGVMCGDALYYTYKFDDFEKMIQEAKSIDNKHKSDVKHCTFVFQAFKDNSYNFQKSCFSQIEFPVNGIENQLENLAKNILEDFHNNS